MAWKVHLVILDQFEEKGHLPISVMDLKVPISKNLKVSYKISVFTESLNGFSVL